MNSPATLNTTSSLASEDGPSLCGSPVGPTIDQSAPAPARANPSPMPAKDSPKKMNAISGRSSVTSSLSAKLQSLLASRLRARLDVNGSPEFVLTWKEWGMQSGPPICALRAQAPRTSGKDSSGWPTPCARDHFPPHTPEYIAEKKAQGHGMANLSDVVMLAPWPTCTVNDARNGRNATASRSNPDSKHHAGTTLCDAVALCGWATPTTRDHKDGSSVGTVETNGLLGRQVWSCPAPTERRAALNPAHSRWLMGYPAAWDSCGATAMLSCRKSRRNS